MKISIFGLGYVGAVSSACLAKDGHDVIGVDVDPGKLEMFRAGTSPIVEEGMPELVKAVVDDGKVTATNDVCAAVSGSALSFVCVGTPSRSNGSQDLSAIERVCEQIGDAIKNKQEPHVVVVRSTVSPGTVEDVLLPILERHSGKTDGEGLDVCFMPEFLREGTSIRDFYDPPYTVIGSRSERATALIKELLASLSCDFHVTSIRTAEMLKYSANVFHATKITFANEMGRICKAYGVDSHEVMELFCRDTALNISTAYLKPGFAYGGSCLPKDLRALLHMAKDRDVELPMLRAVSQSNETHIKTAMERVTGNGRRKVGLIGLSFKSGTDDLRESPLVTLAEHFIGKGMSLSIYDEEVHVARLMGANKRYIETSIPHIAELMTDDCKSLIENSEILVVGIKDPAVISLLHEETRPDHMVIDLVNIPDRHKLEGHYEGICW